MSGQQPVVLVVDDEPAVRAVIGSMVARLGYEPLLASNGAEGVALLRAASGRVAAAVLDVLMPELDGPATLAALRAVDPVLPAVFVSGGIGYYTSDDLIARGASAVLSKPIPLSALESALAAARERSATAGPLGEGGHQSAALPSIPQHLLDLAPLDLPNRRADRYNGGGLGVSLAELAGPDQALVRRVYDAVRAVAGARPGSEWPRRAAEPEFVARVRDVASDEFVRAAQVLGEATARAGAPPLVRKVLHDLRGGALTALVGTAGLLDTDPPDPDLLLTCGRLARDHCKIVRSALPDLDPPGRARDEVFNYHGIEKFVHTWDGATVREYGREVAVAVSCAYRGGVTASCLENAAVDRVLYNHVNNAARFSVDGRVALSIFPVGRGRVIRWVVSNAVTDEHRAWLATALGTAFNALYAGGVTAGGSGVGLASCSDFVAAAFGLDSTRAAVDDGYLGARLTDDTYYAWFHWPAFVPVGPPAE